MEGNKVEIEGGSGGGRYEIEGKREGEGRDEAWPWRRKVGMDVMRCERRER